MKRPTHGLLVNFNIQVIFQLSVRVPLFLLRNRVWRRFHELCRVAFGRSDGEVDLKYKDTLCNAY